MKLFSKSGGTSRVGAIIEIGSGSVLTAVVVSLTSEKQPTIVWAKREFATIGIDYDFARSTKSMLTALMNSMIALDSEGRAALAKSFPRHSIETLQVSITAPWSYTVSKVIEYESETPFTITSALIDNLTEKANQKTMEALSESEKEHGSGLTIMTRATTDITANGYRTMNPIGQTASVVTLTQVSAIAQNLITSAIEDLRQRMFTNTKLERYSAMLVFHSTIKDLYPDMTEYCLVDLTYEATELAIVRGGVLQYTTYTPIGINTLVRNLATRLDTPEGDAATILKRTYDADSLDCVTASEKEAITVLMNEYQNALESLFHETGDSLAIPKVIFLHSSYLHERFFDNYIAAAAKAATSSAHTVHTLSHDLMLTQFTGEQKIDLLKRRIDTGVLMSGQFFHKQGSATRFTQV
ncbi:MAG: hypothetical protein ACK4SL_01520 [Candidatus Paceibacteria bacterium]